MNTPSDHVPPLSSEPPKPPPAASPIPPSEPPRQPPPPEPPPHSTPPPVASQDDRNIALLTHLSGFIFSVIVPLIVWLMYRDRSARAYIVEEAREALNFQITVLIGYVICAILTFIVIGAFLGWLLWIANLVFCVIAAVRTSSGARYRYPFNLRLIQ